MVFRKYLLSIACAVSMLAPAMAQACVWRINDAFMPFPPCPANDAQLQSRLRQGLVRQLVQTGETAMEVYNMKLETQARQGTNQVIQQFVDRMNDVHGDVSTNPLPSLVSAYDTSPVLAMLEGGTGVALAYLPTGTDTTMFGGRDWEQYLATDSISKMYNYSSTAGDTAMLQTLVQLQAMIDSTTRGGDSLLASGGRYAERYQGQGSNAGEAEAAISEAASAAGVSQSAVYLARIRAAEVRTGVQTGARTANRARVREQVIGGHP